MFDKIRKYVVKKKNNKPLSWVDDLFMQAQLGKREGLSAPLFITIEEVEDLQRYQELVIAAEEFWEFHKSDIQWMSDKHSERFIDAMQNLYLNKK